MAGPSAWGLTSSSRAGQPRAALAVQQFPAQVELIDSDISYNVASDSGGGVYVLSGLLSLSVSLSARPSSHGICNSMALLAARHAQSMSQVTTMITPSNSPRTRTGRNCHVR